MRFRSDFFYDRLVWICALPKAEFGPTNRVLEDIEPEILNAGMGFTPYFPRSLFELNGYLAAEAMIGGSPLIHIDSHGARNGISVGDRLEEASWKLLCNAIRPININSGNHTLVVSNCCFGMHAITATSLLEPTPFLGLLAPEEKVLVGDFERSIPNFYSTLLSTDGIDDALNVLKAYDFWLADQFLLQVLVNFVKHEGIGSGKKRHVEELVSKARATGKSLLSEPVSIPRKQIKELLGDQMSPQLLQRFVDSFLFGQEPGYTYEDVVSLARTL